MLRWRLTLGFTIALSIIGLCVFDIYLERSFQIPGLALFPLLMLLITLGVREMLHLANRNQVYPVPYITYLGCWLIALSAWGTFVIQHTTGNSPYLDSADFSESVPDANAPFDGSASIEELARMNPQATPVSTLPGKDSSANVSYAANGSASAVEAQTQDSASQNTEISYSDLEALASDQLPESITNPKNSSKEKLHLVQKLENLTPGNWALSTFALVVIAVFLQEMVTFVRPGAVNIRISYTIFTIVYVGLLPTFLAQIRLCHGLEMLVIFVAIVKMGDVGAFTIGKMLGRNKMAPSLSPGKTIEGAIGALLFSILTSLLFFFWIMPALGHQTSPDRMIWWILYGAVLGFLGMLGDLAESLLKRDAEIKDAGTLVPGFGGVLDILDSLILAAPAAYAVLTLDLLFP